MMDSRALSTIPQGARRALLLVPCLLLLLSTSALADFGETHAVLVMTGVDQAHLELDGWITTANATVAVVEAPRYGAWLNETYFPDDRFWRFGGDRVVLSITDGDSTSTHTIVLVAARPERMINIAEDFESSSGDLAFTAWLETDPVDAVHVTGDALEGDWSLQIERMDGGGSVRQSMVGPPEKGINGVDQLGGKGAVNPDLPGGGGGGGGGGGEPNPLRPTGEPVTILALNDLARAEMRFGLGGDIAQVRAVASPILGCLPCETDWRDIPLGADTAIGLWLGRDHLEHPSSAAVTLHFAVHPPNGQISRDRLTGLRTILPADFELIVGAHGAPDIGSVKLDLIEGWWDQVVRAIPLQVTAEAFAEGAWGNVWQVHGPFGVTPTFGKSNWYGSVDISDLQRRRDPRAALIDSSVDSAERLRVELEVVLDRNALVSGTQFTVWSTAISVGHATEPDSFHPVSLQVQQTDAGPEIRAWIRDSHGRGDVTPWLALPSDGRQSRAPIVLQWWAENAQGFGGLELQVGDRDASIGMVRNRGQAIVEHAVGVWSLQVPTVFGQAVDVRTSTSTVRVDDLILSY